MNEQHKTDSRPNRRINWAAPLAALVMGLAGIAITRSQGHGTPERAVGAVAIVIVYTVLLIALQYRSETARTIVGSPADERWALIHKNALAASSWIGILAGLVAYVVVEVTGGENWQFAVMIVVLSLGYFVSLFWYRARL